MLHRAALSLSIYIIYLYLYLSIYIYIYIIYICIYSRSMQRSISIILCMLLSVYNTSGKQLCLTVCSYLSSVVEMDLQYNVGFASMLTAS